MEVHMEIQGAASAASLAGAMRQAETGAQVIIGTLNNMNTDPVSGNVNADYDFQNKVLASRGIGKNLNATV
jgi:hypothetical protein